MPLGKRCSTDQPGVPLEALGLKFEGDLPAKSLKVEALAS